jgi:hypothetical protein
MHRFQIREEGVREKMNQILLVSRSECSRVGCEPFYHPKKRDLLNYNDKSNTMKRTEGNVGAVKVTCRAGPTHPCRVLRSVAQGHHLVHEYNSTNRKGGGLEQRNADK